MKPVLRLIATAAAVMLAAPALAQQPPSAPFRHQDSLQPTADGAQRHLTSGFVFPASLGTLKATGLRAFADDDIMIRYGNAALPSSWGWVDLFIYRSSASLDDEAGEVARVIADNYGATPLQSEASLPASAADGRSGWYRGNIAGRAMTTGFLLVRRGDWRVKARATAYDTAGPEAAERIRQALAAAPWDWSPAEQADERVVAAQ